MKVAGWLVVTIGAFGLIFSTATGVLAQDDAVDPWAGRDIAPDDWRDMVLGKTVTYAIGPEFFALERYAATGDLVELQLADGSCLTGRWWHQDLAYCFDWGEGRTPCFRHVALGDEIIIIELRDGETTDRLQRVDAIGSAPLACSLNMS